MLGEETDIILGAIYVLLLTAEYAIYATKIIAVVPIPKAKSTVEQSALQVLESAIFVIQTLMVVPIPKEQPMVV